MLGKYKHFGRTTDMYMYIFLFVLHTSVPLSIDFTNFYIKSDIKVSEAAIEETNGARSKFKKDKIPTTNKKVEVRKNCISAGDCKS